jgi:hypothetical protein
MSLPVHSSGSTPPPPPPLDPGKQADELIALNTHEVCKGSKCRQDTDGVGVGTQLAGAASSDPAKARAVFDKTMDKTPAGAERREVARGLVQTMNYQELRQLAGTPDGRAMLERARTELKGSHQGDDKTAATRIDTALKGAELQNDPGFKKLDAAGQQQVLDAIGRQEDHPKAVDNLVALAKTPAFQAAAPATRTALLGALSQHPQDALFREGLGKLAGDAAFKKLTPAQQGEAIATFDKVAKSTAYQGSAGSPAHGIPGKHVSAADQQKVLDNARKIVTSAGFHDMGAGASRDALMGALNRHAADTGFADRLAKLANDPGLLALNDTAKETKLLERYGTDKSFAQGVDTLLGNAKYTALSGADRAKVLGDVVKLSDTKSYKDETNAANKRALVEIVGDISAFSAAHPGNATLRNTLNQVVDGHVKLSLYQRPTFTSGGQTFFNWGQADAHGIQLNIHPSVRSVAEAQNQYIDTLAHEVNHKLNGVTTAGTADRFLDEYRAAVVGQEAALGRTLTPAEQRAAVNNLVDGTNPDYAHLAHLYNTDAKFKAGVDAISTQLNGTPHPASGSPVPAATVSPEDARAKLLAAGNASPYLNTAGNVDNH